MICLEGFGAGTTLRYVAKDGAAQVYAVVDPTTPGRDGFISVTMTGGSRSRLTADDVVVVPPPGPVITVTDITPNGAGYTYSSHISGDGSTVVFHSVAGLILPGQGDGNHTYDVFAYDVATGGLTNLTRSGNNDSFVADISADGSRVAFTSAATNLADTEAEGDAQTNLFVLDRDTGEINNVTRGVWDYIYDVAISADGATVAFTADSSMLVDGQITTLDVLLYDLATGEVANVTEGGDSYSSTPSLSDDGLTVAFQSRATNLLDGQADSNGHPDIFVHDRDTGQTVNVTHGADGESTGPSLSADGSRVVFQSAATNLVAGETDRDGDAADVFIFDLATGRTVNVTEGWSGEVRAVGISADGATVAFLHLPPGQVATQYDRILERDLILYDVASGDTANVTAGWNGFVESASLSEDAEAGSFTATPKNGRYSDVYAWEVG